MKSGLATEHLIFLPAKAILLAGMHAVCAQTDPSLKLGDNEGWDQQAA